jgi:Rieske Fe-S protein
MNRREFVIAGAAIAGALAVSPEDLTAADAPAKTIDIGPLESYSKDGVTDTWAGKTSHKILIIRHEGRLYAATSVCTHKNCIVKPKGEGLVCPCHGSKYTLMGVPTKGPAKHPLFRYGISVDDQKHVIVDKSKQFEENDWESEGAFIKTT